jgi:hypothetical protein
MMKKRALFLLCVAVTATVLATGESLTIDNPENILVLGGIKLSCSAGEFTAAGTGALYGKKYLPINTAKHYRLSGEFKAAPGSAAGDYIRFGLVPSTEWSQIQPVNINIVPGTATELAADCKETDTIIKLKDASKWKGNILTVVAFDVDPGDKMRDMPNFNISKTGAVKLEQKDGIWLLTLKQPCGRNYPAGTAVREHCAGWSLIYAGSPKLELKPEWQKIDVVIEPGEVAQANINRWWQGTQKTSFCIEAAGKGVVFRNLELKEVTE